jgi:hypothetical protein
MIGIVMLAAAAQAPLLLASNDEAQWRLFVRASLQRPAAPAPRLRDGSRLIQLQGVVRHLGDDRDRSQRLAGPSGL